MYPLLNGEPQVLPAYVRYGRKCHSYIDVPCDDDEFQNEPATTPAILTPARSTKSASKQKWKTKKISVTSRSFRLADHSLVCSWCMTTFEGSQANAEKHMRDFHGHQVKVLSLPPPQPDALLQNQDRRATLRPKPHRLRQQSTPPEETRYGCPWPFDNECSLQAQKKTLGSMDEMVRHMAGAHIGPTFFCHLCHWYCWEKKAVLEHPKYCRGLSGIRFRELQNRQWDQIRDSILNGGMKFKGNAPSNSSPSAGNTMQE